MRAAVCHSYGGPSRAGGTDLGPWPGHRVRVRLGGGRGRSARPSQPPRMRTKGADPLRAGRERAGGVGRGGGRRRRRRRWQPSSAPRSSARSRRRQSSIATRSCRSQTEWTSTLPPPSAWRIAPPTTSALGRRTAAGRAAHRPRCGRRRRARRGSARRTARCLGDSRSVVTREARRRRRLRSGQRH